MAGLMKLNRFVDEGMEAIKGMADKGASAPVPEQEIVKFEKAVREAAEYFCGSHSQDKAMREIIHVMTENLLDRVTKKVKEGITSPKGKED
jgi:hypothetical protein